MRLKCAEYVEWSMKAQNYLMHVLQNTWQIKIMTAIVGFSFLNGVLRKLSQNMNHQLNKDPTFTSKPEQVEKKWRNVVQRYKNFVQNVHKTGQGRSRKPEFYDEVDRLLGSSQTVRPQYTVGMGLTPSVASTSSEVNRIIIEPDIILEEEPSEFEQGPNIVSEPVKKKRIRPLTRMESVQTSISELVSASLRHNEDFVNIHREKLDFEREKFEYYSKNIEEDARERRHLRSEIHRTNYLLETLIKRVENIEKFLKLDSKDD